MGTEMPAITSKHSVSPLQASFWTSSSTLGSRTEERACCSQVRVTSPLGRLLGCWFLSPPVFPPMSLSPVLAPGMNQGFAPCPQMRLS